MRPPFEVADIIGAAGKGFIENNRSWLTTMHLKVLSAVERCRTAALGGHKDRCSQCGHVVAISYNSCRNRHCPKCLNHAREKWLSARKQELLAVPYMHIVFTLPHTLSTLALHNKALLYTLLFRASASTLLEIAADPKHLGAKIGFFSILHTWGQNLLHHPHIHCVIPAGGLSSDRKAWISPRYRFFLPCGVLSRVFRGKFISGLKRAYRQNKLNLAGDLHSLRDKKSFHAFLRELHQHQWVVYSKPPFGGANHVLNYLARYTHRVAISNHRLVALSDGKVTFRWKDYAHGNQQKLMTVTVEEFLRRFLLHTLPRGFVRIRFFGYMANRQRKELLTICRELIGTNSESEKSDLTQVDDRNAWLCPRCGGPMVVILRLTAEQIAWESFGRMYVADTS
ncbi:MAG: IS91 family transposase [Anaerolineales bacterium]